MIYSATIELFRFEDYEVSPKDEKCHATRLILH